MKVECQFCLTWFSVALIGLVVLAGQFDVTNAVTQLSSRFPALMLAYKVEVAPGKEDCYFQYIMGGSILYVEFQVIKGGDLKMGFQVKEPNGTIVMPYAWKKENRYQTDKAMDGNYMLCVDNRPSKFVTKVAFIYLHSFYSEDSTQYLTELAEIEKTVGNFSQTVTTVDTNLGHVRNLLYHSRAYEGRDYAAAKGTNSYVNFWSMAQCLVIIVVGALQIFFIRRLFDPPETVSRKVHVYSASAHKPKPSQRQGEHNNYKQMT